MALVATLGSTRSSAARQRIAAALEDAQRRSREAMVAVLGYLAETLGLRLRDPGYTLDHVQLAGGLLVQSLALRNVQVQAALAPEDAAAQDGSADAGAGTAAGGRATPPLSEPTVVNDLLNAPIPGPGLHGGQAEWTLAAQAYLGVLDAFVELDPERTLPAP
jgi:hypothetical protein